MALVMASLWHGDALRLNPMLAGAAVTRSHGLVVGNSLRLRAFRLTSKHVR
ncbi:hypothetical protein [Microbacterium murale]|uniref:Cation transport ATPase n=1 Tax=Microbacterium murale TaxID=1081040 RepID=A0ABU0PB16_9MICO|nr:hypothetical protein [Microbacterium murale]MDQ0644526.1 cation transport ATPase [Microbacterium murale]